MFEIKSSDNINFGKDWSQQVEHMQVPNGTGPGGKINVVT